MLGNKGFGTIEGRPYESQETINRIYDNLSSNERKPEELIWRIIEDRTKEPSERIKLIDEALTNISPELLLPDVQALIHTVTSWTPFCENSIQMHEDYNQDESKQLTFGKIYALRDKFHKVVSSAALLAPSGFHPLVKDTKNIQKEMICRSNVSPEVRIPEDCYNKVLFSATLSKVSQEDPSWERKERLTNLLNETSSLIEEHFLSLDTKLPSQETSLKEYLLTKINRNIFSGDQYKHQNDVIDFLKLILEKAISNLSEKDFLIKLEAIAQKIGKNNKMGNLLALYKTTHHSNKIYYKIFGDAAAEQEKRPEELLKTILGHNNKKLSEQMKLIDEALTNISPEILLPDDEAFLSTLSSWNAHYEAWKILENHSELKLDSHRIDMLCEKFYGVIISAAPGFKSLDDPNSRPIWIRTIPDEYKKPMLYARNVTALSELLAQERQQIRSNLLRIFLENNNEFIENNFLLMDTKLESGNISFKDYLLSEIKGQYKYDVVAFLKVILGKDNKNGLSDENFLSILTAIAKKMGSNSRMMGFVAQYKELKCITEGPSNESKAADDDSLTFSRDSKKQLLSDMPRGTTQYSRNNNGKKAVINNDAKNEIRQENFEL